jgi:sugar-specific transcriptional regulator TrmB
VEFLVSSSFLARHLRGSGGLELSLLKEIDILWYNINMFEKYLQDIGLSDKEASVYIALLSVDNDSVLDLASKTKINRTTIYPVLESLAQKGLISEIKIDKKVRFQAEPPERLETYVERRKIQLEEQEKRLKDIIPQLRSIYKEDSEKPVVKFYEGREGIISMTEEIFQSKEKGGTMYMIYPRDLIEGIFSESESARFRKIRLNQNISGKSIYTYSKGELDPNSYLGNRLKIDEKKYPISCDITVYNNKVRIATLGSKLGGMLVYNKDFAQTLISLFELAFKNIDKK